MLVRLRHACAARPLALIFLVALCVVASGCGGQNQPVQQSQQTQARRYQLKGRVVEVDKAQGHLVVDGEEIPGFMSAMTMPYPVADPKSLEGIAPGDQITADVVVANGGARLENIVVVKKGTGAPPSPTGQLSPVPQNSTVPDFAFVNQDGKQVHLRQFAGKSVLLTFIYTHCPLPDYCPLMTHNFAEIDKRLAKTPAAYSKTHLLSISFDPKNDTPQVLRGYGLEYVADRGRASFAHWEFAAVPAPELTDVTKFFDVFVREDEGQITHSMSTAIISPDGKLFKWYSGNDWMPSDVTADLLSSLHSPS